MCCFDHPDLCLWCGLSKPWAVKAVAVPNLLNARTCCTFWRNLLRLNSCSSSDCELEAGRNGLVERMTAGNDCLLLTSVIMPQRMGTQHRTGAFLPSSAFRLWKSYSTPGGGGMGSRYGLGAETALPKWTASSHKENFTTNLEWMRK